MEEEKKVLLKSDLTIFPEKPVIDSWSKMAGGETYFVLDLRLKSWFFKSLQWPLVFLFLISIVHKQLQCRDLFLFLMLIECHLMLRR